MITIVCGDVFAHDEGIDDDSDDSDSTRSLLTIMLTIATIATLRDRC